MNVIDFQHERDLATARAEFIREGGTKAQWQEIRSSLDEAARRFFENNLTQTGRRQST
ncbi:MAG: hypothetical protein ACJ8FU_15930 [Xanthobacteraceae bacterium]|jgi:hypothetical protein